MLVAPGAASKASKPWVKAKIDQKPALAGDRADTFRLFGAQVNILGDAYPGLTPGGYQYAACFAGWLKGPTVKLIEKLNGSRPHVPAGP